MHKYFIRRLVTTMEAMDGVIQRLEDKSEYKEAVNLMDFLDNELLEEWSIRVAMFKDAGNVSGVLLPKEKLILEELDLGIHNNLR